MTKTSARRAEPTLTRPDRKRPLSSDARLVFQVVPTREDLFDVIWPIVTDKVVEPETALDALRCIADTLRAATEQPKGKANKES
jgi:hypothetical protein